MKGFVLLLLYFFTWRSVILGSVCLGLLLLGFAASVAPVSSSGAGALSMLAFVFMLVVPYISAPKMLRAIISNRRLAIVPALPLTTGLAMLLLTLMTAVFVPLSGWLLGAPTEIYWLGPNIFIIASLYTFVTQLLVTSRYVWVHIQWLPIAVIVLISLFGEELWSVATDRTATVLLAGLAAAGWLYTLTVLARRRNFKPAYATDITMADQETNSWFSSWVNRTPDQVPAPVASLLLGYAANLRSRLANIVFIIVVNPLVAVLLMKFLGRNGGDKLPISTTDWFLIMSVATSFVAGAIAWAETGARTRLLWLRLPGARQQIWQALERELWVYVLLLLLTTAMVIAMIALLGEGSLLLVHYVLLLFTMTMYQRYLPLAARVNNWSSLAQALVMIVSIAAIAFTMIYSLSVASFNLAFLLELCFLLFGVLFRALAKFGFNRVDWQVLRPTISKRVGAASA
jgi:hypothetical protein